MPRLAPLSQQLRDRLRTCDKTMYEVAQKTGVAASTLSRFLSKKRDLSADAIDRLGRYLELELRESHLTLTAEEKQQEILAVVCRPMTPDAKLAKRKRR